MRVSEIRVKRIRVNQGLGVQRYVQQYVYQLMAVFCDRLKLGSKAALDCYAGQNKGKYCKKRALFPT